MKQPGGRRSDAPGRSGDQYDFIFHIWRGHGIILQWRASDGALRADHSARLFPPPPAGATISKVSIPAL